MPCLRFEEKTQKKLALLNKDKTILILPWLSSNLQKWIYQEAQEGRFDQDEVCKVLKKGKESVSSTDWGQNLQKRDWLQTEAAKSLRLR